MVQNQFGSQNYFVERKMLLNEKLLYYGSFTALPYYYIIYSCVDNINMIHKIFKLKLKFQIWPTFYSSKLLSITIKCYFEKFTYVIELG